MSAILYEIFIGPFSLYQSKWKVTSTSERGCPIHNDVSGRLWYLQIRIECNVVIITEIYIISTTSVTLSFWFIFVQARQPEPRKCVGKRAFYWLFSRTQQHARHRCARSVYRTTSLVKIGFLCLVLQSLRTHFYWYVPFVIRLQRAW